MQPYKNRFNKKNFASLAEKKDWIAGLQSVDSVYSVNLLNIQLYSTQMVECNTTKKNSATGT